VALDHLAASSTGRMLPAKCYLLNATCSTLDQTPLTIHSNWCEELWSVATSRLLRPSLTKATTSLPGKSAACPHLRLPRGGRAPSRQSREDNSTAVSWPQISPRCTRSTNAALFVLPSDLEGLPLALLEAMGAGVCVLTSDTPENCEVIEGTGFTFKRGDVLDLERMLDLLLSDPRLRAASGMSGQQRARHHYLWETIVKEIDAVYAGLIGPSTTRKTTSRPVEASGRVA